MTGVGLGFASSVCWGIGDFIGGLLARRIGAVVVLYANQLTGLVLAFAAVIVLADDGLSTGQAAAAAGAGAVACTALGAFYRALAIGPISVVATLASLGVAVPVVVGLSRGESPSELQAVGVALAIGGGILVAREPGGGHAPAGRTVVLLSIAASLGFGLFFVGVESAADADPIWAVAAVRVGGVGTLLALWPVLRPQFRAARAHAGPLISVGVFDVSANALYALATTYGLLSLIAPAASLYALVTVILARLFLSERVPTARAIAIALALAGVVLIAAG